MVAAATIKGRSFPEKDLNSEEEDGELVRSYLFLPGEVFFGAYFQTLENTLSPEGLSLNGSSGGRGQRR